MIDLFVGAIILGWIVYIAWLIRRDIRCENHKRKLTEELKAAREANTVHLNPPVLPEAFSGTLEVRDMMTGEVIHGDESGD